MEPNNLTAKLSEILNADDNFTNGCQNIVADIRQQHSRLLELVEGLHNTLTDTRPDVREKGVRILSQVLQLLPDDFLTDDEVAFILKFFVDRLKDHHSIIPLSLQGIFSILQMQNVPSKMPDYLLTGMNQNINCQTQLHNDRYIIYNIINELVKKYPVDLKNLGPDFIFQVISNIDGERDPRNLMFLFHMMPQFLKQFPLGHLTEEMFDVFSCYFPVDFYSATNSPSSVTREQLADGLASCLTAVPEFAEFCYPLIFEKLDSTRKEAKLDCFNLLKIGFSKFPTSAVEVHLTEIWKNIRLEALPGIDKDIREAALQALSALIYNLSVSPLSNEHTNVLNTVILSIIKDTLPTLKDVEMNAFFPSAQLLLCVAESSVSACTQIAINIVPVLQTQYYSATSVGQKATVLQSITSFLNICDSKGTTSQVSETGELLKILKEAQALYYDAASTENEELLVEAINGLGTIVCSLDNNKRCKLYDILAACLKQQEKKMLRQVAVTCLQKMAKIYPDEIMTNMVLSKLKVFEGGGDTNFEEVFECCQFALCEIAYMEPFTPVIVSQFLHLVIETRDFKKQLLGIKCLQKLLEAPGNVRSIHMFLLEKHCVSSLMSWCFKNVQEEVLNDSIHHVEFLKLVAKVVECIVRELNESVQQDVIIEFVPWFLHPEACTESEKRVSPLHPASPASYTYLVMLLEGLLASIKQEVSLQSRDELINSLMALGVETAHEHTQISASRLLGNLVNKATDDEKLRNCLAKILEMVKHILNSEGNTVNKNNAVKLLIWVTKALVMRGHEEACKWLSSLVDQLHDESVSTVAANGFQTIMKENEEYFSQMNFCNIRLLFKQHLFVITREILVESHHSAVSVKAKCSHLLSLMHILQGVPHQVFCSDLPKIMPLLVESLELHNVPLLLSTLETLASLLQEKRTDVADYLNTFITKFLLLSQFKEAMSVRIAALECLYQLCFYPTHTVLPYKDQVVRQLSKCLDDKKRLVRFQAVRARTRWFVVGSPGEPPKT